LSTLSDFFQFYPRQDRGDLPPNQFQIHKNMILINTHMFSVNEKMK
jgi:hypothetical protein